MKARTGLTLIELAVVIAVAREKGRQTKCLSNLQQLGNAMDLYCDDYYGMLPGMDWVPKRKTWILTTDRGTWELALSVNKDGKVASLQISESYTP